MKKRLPILLSAALLLALAAPAAAAEPRSGGPEITIQGVLQDAGQHGTVPRSLLYGQTGISIIPTLPTQERYTYVSYVAAGFLIEDGVAYCGGIVSLYDSLDFDYKIQLQRQTSASTWTTVKTWTHTGNKYASTEDSYTLTTSGEYRCYVTAYVKGSNGAFVETVPCSSGSDYYSKG